MDSQNKVWLKFILLIFVLPPVLLAGTIILILFSEQTTTPQWVAASLAASVIISLVLARFEVTSETERAAWHLMGWVLTLGEDDLRAKKRAFIRWFIREMEITRAISLAWRATAFLAFSDIAFLTVIGYFEGLLQA